MNTTIAYFNLLAAIIIAYPSCKAPEMEINDRLVDHTDIGQFIATNYVSLNSSTENPFEPLKVNYRCVNDKITIGGFRPSCAFAYLAQKGFAFYFIIPDNGKILTTMEGIYGPPSTIANLTLEQANSAYYIWEWGSYRIYFKKFNYTYSNLPKNKDWYSIIISNMKMRDLGPRGGLK